MFCFKDLLKCCKTEYSRKWSLHKPFIKFADQFEIRVGLTRERGKQLNKTIGNLNLLVGFGLSACVANIYIFSDLWYISSTLFIFFFLSTSYFALSLENETLGMQHYLPKIQMVPFFVAGGLAVVTLYLQFFPISSSALCFLFCVLKFASWALSWFFCLTVYQPPICISVSGLNYKHKILKSEDPTSKISLVHPLVSLCWWEKFTRKLEEQNQESKIPSCLWNIILNYAFEFTIMKELDFEFQMNPGNQKEEKLFYVWVPTIQTYIDYDRFLECLRNSRGEGFGIKDQFILNLLPWYLDNFHIHWISNTRKDNKNKK